MAPIMLANPMTYDMLEALVAPLADLVRDRPASLDGPDFSFVGSPIRWRMRLFPHHDDATGTGVRPELMRVLDDGRLVWSGVDRIGVFETVREAVMAGLDAANGVERLLASDGERAWLWDEPPRALLIRTDGATIDLARRFGRTWVAAGPDHVVAPDPTVALPLAGDDGTLELVRLRRGRYRAGGLALELVDEWGTSVAMLTADAGLTQAADPYVALDAARLGDGIVSWATSFSLGSDTGERVSDACGHAQPLFALSEAYVLRLPEMGRGPR